MRAAPATPWLDANGQVQEETSDSEFMFLVLKVVHARRLLADRCPSRTAGVS